MIVTITFWVKLGDDSDELVELVIEQEDQVYALYWPDDQFILKGDLESLREIIDAVRGVMGWED